MAKQYESTVLGNNAKDVTKLDMATHAALSMEKGTDIDLNGDGKINPETEHFKNVAFEKIGDKFRYYGQDLAANKMLQSMSQKTN